MMNGLPAADVPVAAPSHAKLSSNRNIFSLNIMAPTRHRSGATFQLNSFRTGYNFSERIQKLTRIIKERISGAPFTFTSP